MLKDPIQCPYCQEPASPLRGPLGIPEEPTNTRYGCRNAHYFAVPTKSVETNAQRS